MSALNKGESMNHYFDQLVSGLQSAQGGNLVSVIVYGWGVVATGNPRRSDYQLLIVTERLAARDLRQMRPIIRQWTEMGYEMQFSSQPKNSSTRWTSSRSNSGL